MSDEQMADGAGGTAEEQEAAQAGMEEAAGEGMAPEDGPAYDYDAIMAAAREQGIATKASWSLLSKELFVLLFANCLFFTGAIASWNRGAPGEAVNRAVLDSGLDTIRGAGIFALALYGFWACVFNIWGRQMVLWPFVVNALVALWIGIGGFTKGIGGEAWELAKKKLEELPGKTMMDDWTYPLSTIAPAYWLLTAGGVIVMIVILKGILGGAAKAKEAKAAAGAGRARRR